LFSGRQAGRQANSSSQPALNETPVLSLIQIIVTGESDSPIFL